VIILVRHDAYVQCAYCGGIFRVSAVRLRHRSYFCRLKCCFCGRVFRTDNVKCDIFYRWI
jgi:hypothetical protein